MSDLISKIRQDHANMGRILKLISSEIDALVAEEPRDLEVLNDAMHYMINYADSMHHPKEDVMFNRLRELAPETGELVDEIFHEHREITERGLAFHELVKAVEYGDFVLRREIVRRGKEYVQTLYSHMRKEEEKLLTAAQRLTEERADVDLGVDPGDLEDPLFGEEVRREFKNLFDHIVNRYGDDWRHPAHTLV